MANKFTHEQLLEFKEIFKLFDKNGTGQISTKDLGQMLRHMGESASEREVQKMIQNLDSDCSGTVDFEEFLKVLDKALQEPLTEKEIRDAFKAFDSDNSGSITAGELKQVIAKLGLHLTESEINEMIAEADSSHDGNVSYDEFVQLLKRR